MHKSMFDPCICIQAKNSCNIDLALVPAVRLLASKEWSPGEICKRYSLASELRLQCLLQGNFYAKTLKMKISTRNLQKYVQTHPNYMDGQVHRSNKRIKICRYIVRLFRSFFIYLFIQTDSTFVTPPCFSDEQNSLKGDNFQIKKKDFVLIGALFLLS